MSLVACQHDATLRELDTVALTCEPSDSGFRVVLEDTVLYPEGGGQPADHGRIGSSSVVDVQIVGGTVVHTTESPVQPGPVHVSVDWPRRLDHMQQHTGQHLLTAVAQDRFGLATTSFHLHPIVPGRPVPCCDIEIDGEPSATQLVHLERAVNQAIREDHPVVSRVLDRGAYASIQVRSRGIPDGVEHVRIVEIEGIDANTCGGTHVPSTRHLQALKLLGTERIRGGTRLSFAVGNRALAMLDEAHHRTNALNRLLSEGPGAHVQAIQRLLDRTRAADKTIRALQTELAELLGAELAARDEAVVTLHRDDADNAFLNAVANRAVSDGDPRLFLLTAGTGEEGLFLLVGPPERVAAAKPDILAVLGARGGGRPGRLQGRATRLSARDRAAELLR